MLSVQRAKPSVFNTLSFFGPIYPHPPNRPYPGPTSSRGKGARPATIAAAGGDRAGLGWRGLLRRVRGLPSLGSPPAVGVDGDPARVLPIGPRPRRLESVGNDRFRVRLSLNRAAYRTLADNERAERSASSKRYLFKALRTSSGAPRHFPTRSRFGVGSHPLAPTWRLRRLSRRGGGGRVLTPSSPSGGRRPRSGP